MSFTDSVYADPFNLKLDWTYAKEKTELFIGH